MLEEGKPKFSESLELSEEKNMWFFKGVFFESYADETADKIKTYLMYLRQVEFFMAKPFENFPSNFEKVMMEIL